MVVADTQSSGVKWPQRWRRCWSKADIHAIIRELAESGIGIVVISDDLPELLTTCGRILMMKEGRIDSIVMAGEMDEIELAAKLAS